jgi:hypothetical protein
MRFILGFAVGLALGYGFASIFTKSHEHDLTCFQERAV